MICHGDAREILPAIPKDSVDAVLTDPPFFMPAVHYQSRIDWQRSWSDTSILATFWAAILDLVIPSIKPTGHFLTFCNGDSYPVFYPEMYRRFDSLKLLVWDKGRVGLGRIWRNQHELVIAARWNESRFVEDGLLRADIFRSTPTRSAKREHPVQKPYAVLSWLLKPCVPRGGTILDPFAGSGTILEAAASLGLKVIAIEGEERYCKIMAKCLNRESQETLPPGTSGRST